MKLPKIIVYVPFLNYSGMAIFPFILVKRKAFRFNKILINHEKIHLQQQLELLILPFYILYLSNYFFNRFRYASHDEAYRNIYFEKEAYANEENLEYLQKRKLWSFMNYLKRDK